MKRLIPVLVFLYGTAPAATAAEQPRAAAEILSPTYTVDRVYKSMQGPQSTQTVRLSDAEPPELLWITGYEAVMVGPDGASPMPQEFMCHSNLDFQNVGRHNELFGNRPITTRLFTLSQGQFVVKFPGGFGIPIMSDEPLDLTTQVLNHNLREGSAAVRHKVTIRYLRDRDAPAPMKPLFTIGVYGLALLTGTEPYFGVEHPEPSKHGSGCMIGSNASTHTYTDSNGRIFTGHWVVPPGRQVNRTLVTRMMNLPFDTTIHAIAAHLHPFAESLELRDITADKTVFVSRAENFPDRIGLTKVDAYASVEGIPVFKDHEYELVSVYNNTSGVDQDSMAVLLLYLRDADLKATEPAETPPQQSAQSAP